MNWITLAATIFLASFLSSSRLANAEPVIIIKNTNSSLKIGTNVHTKYLKLDIVVADFEVNCSSSKMIAWGQTNKTLKIGEVPYSQIYMIDLKTSKTLNSYTVTRGPFDVKFLVDGKRALADEYLLDLHTGKIIDKEITSEDGMEFESCAKATSNEK
jgi:hypothetical protein